MNKQYTVLILFLMTLSGCGKCCKKKNRNLSCGRNNKTELFSEVDIPVAEEVLHNVLDGDDIRPFQIEDMNEDLTASFDPMEETWIEDLTQVDAFKVVLFDFDKIAPRKDQEAVISADIKVAERILDEGKNLSDKNGSTRKIKISGHACHSAGSAAYNLALSEKRAKTIADRFVAAGLPSEDIKIVGYGMEIPAVIDGKTVEGNREQQAPNRRAEISVIYT